MTNRYETPEKNDVRTKISPSTQINKWRKKCHIRLIRSAIIKKTSQDGQQNQTTTKIICIQNLMSNLKKNNKQVKRASDKTETPQKTCTSIEKIWDQSIIGRGNKWTK